ncbi:DoxX family protein [Streptomyces sp. NPDC056634]|uniref:DoxX family protein n=1 Tax=unclassified Streptomyces TaxID=2593676 RepID=UPI00368F84F9
MLEILGPLGLVLPPITGIAAALVPVVAVGLAAVMVGAAITHAHRGEFQMIAANALVLALVLALAAVIAWGRFDPYGFASRASLPRRFSAAPTTHRRPASSRRRVSCATTNPCRRAPGAG